MNESKDIMQNDDIVNNKKNDMNNNKMNLLEENKEINDDKVEKKTLDDEIAHILNNNNNNNKQKNTAEDNEQIMKDDEIINNDKEANNNNNNNNNNKLQQNNDKEEAENNNNNNKERETENNNSNNKEREAENNNNNNNEEREEKNNNNNNNNEEREEKNNNNNNNEKREEENKCERKVLAFDNIDDYVEDDENIYKDEELVDRHTVIEECRGLQVSIQDNYLSAIRQKGKYFRAKNACKYPNRHKELTSEFCICFTYSLHCVACVQLQQYWMNHTFPNVIFSLSKTELKAIEDNNKNARNSYFLNFKSIKRGDEIIMPKSLISPPPKRKPIIPPKPKPKPISAPIQKPIEQKISKPIDLKIVHAEAIKYRMKLRDNKIYMFANILQRDCGFVNFINSIKDDTKLYNSKAKDEQLAMIYLLRWNLLSDKERAKYSKYEANAFLKERAWVRITQGLFAGEYGMAKFTTDNHVCVQLSPNIIKYKTENGRELTQTETDYLQKCHDIAPQIYVRVNCVEIIVYVEESNIKFDKIQPIKRPKSKKKNKRSYKRVVKSRKKRKRKRRNDDNNNYEKQNQLKFKIRRSSKGRRIKVMNAK